MICIQCCIIHYHRHSHSMYIKDQLDCHRCCASPFVCNCASSHRDWRCWLLENLWVIAYTLYKLNHDELFEGFLILSTDSANGFLDALSSSDFSTICLAIDSYNYLMDSIYVLVYWVCIVGTKGSLYKHERGLKISIAKRCIYNQSFKPRSASNGKSHIC